MIWLSTSAAMRFLIDSSSFFGSNERFGLPTAARIFSMASRIGCAAWCANKSASMTVASLASAAPPSTITIASLLHATTMSMSAAACSSKVG